MGNNWVSEEEEGGLRGGNMPLERSRCLGEIVEVIMGVLLRILMESLEYQT